jgi:DNA-binding NarL/FixJ family response regulator
MQSYSADMLSFVQLLVGADDPASLYAAFEVGLGAIFSHHSFVSSFAFDREHGGPLSTWSCPARPEHTPDWWARNAAMHPGYEYAYEHPGIPVCLCSDAISNSEFEKHPYYQTFAKPEGYRYAMAILVWDGAQVAGYVAINRTRKQGDFKEGERATALRLHPFIAAAYRRISSARVATDVRLAQERLLASLPLAVLIYSTRDGKVLFQNRASKEALARWRGESHKKRPRAITARWLPEEILNACTSVPATGVTVSNARAPIRAVLRRMDPGSHFASDVVLIVIEDDDAAPGRMSGAWLRVARKLSTAERDVAKLVARGFTNAEIGKHLGKSALTVKKQLEAVFSKAGVANRAELTAVAAGFAPKVRRAG